MEWLILFGIGSSSYVILRLIIKFYESDGRDISRNAKTFISVVIFISAYGSFFYYEQTTSIKDEGIYYVNLFEKKDDQKNYRVPGRIYKDEDGYKLAEIYWSNGGQLTFNNDFGDLILGEKVQVRDDKSKDWYAELTNKKVNTK